MANEFKYTLTFESLSTGTGAKVTADGVDAVAVATDRLNQKQAALNAEFGAVSDRFDVTRTAYYDLGAEIDRTRQKQERIPEANNQVRVSSRNTSMALLELSRGFEDAQYGIRGVLNNIPSLVLSLGGTAGLAGGISIAAVALSQIIPLFTQAEEKAVDFTDKINEAAAGAARIEADRFEAVGNAIDAAAEASKAMNQQWELSAKAEQDFSASALTNAEKLAQAQSLIAQALGLQVDRFRELEALAAREEARRQQAAAAAIAAEEEKLRKAREAVTSAADNFAAQESRAKYEEIRLQKLRAQLDALTEQEIKLKRIADTTFSLGEALTPDGSGGGFILPGSKTPEAQAAQKQLDNPVFQAQLEATRQKVEGLERNIESLTKDGGVVARAENAFLTAQNQLADTQNAVATNIQRISDTLAADQSLAKAQQLVTTGEEFAKELQTALGKIQTNTTEGAAAKTAILAAADDGIITAKETQTVVENLRVLIGLIQTNSTGMVANTKELMDIQRNLGLAVGSHASEIQLLKNQVRDLQTRN